MRAAAAVLLAAALAAACRPSYRHDESAAAAEAVSFARAAFLKKDTAAGYAMLSPMVTQDLTREAFEADLRKMSEDGLPPSLKAVGWEPVAGRPAVNVMLSGEAGEKRWFYRVLLWGRAGEPYRVAGYYRGNGPFPGAGSKRPLPPDAFKTD